MDRTALKLLPIIMMLLFSSFAAVSISESSDASDTCSVDFQPNGGTGAHVSFVVEKGKAIELPATAYTRSGYYLSGWSASSQEYAPGKSYVVNDDVTFKAEWASLPSGFEYISEASATIGKGEEYTFDAPTESRPNDESPWYEWYYFDSAGGFMSVDVDESDAPGWLTLARDEDTRSNVFSGSTMESGVYLVAYTCTMKTSDSISGTHERVSSVCWTITVRSDADTQAKIDFDVDGGDGSIPSITGRIGTVVTLPGEGSLTKDGFTLAGWDIRVTEGLGTFALNSYFTLDGSYTATAHWLPEANVVILDGSGQIGNQIEAFVGYNQQTITLPSEGYSKEGCTFAGWRLTSAPDEIFALGYIYTIEGPTYMTAYYVPNGSETVTVTFDSNGGTGVLSQTVEPGMTIVLPERGFSNETNLEGWVNSSDGDTYLPGDRVEVSEDTVFSAVWGTEAPDVVTVTFDLNGGSGSVATQILNYEDRASRPSDPVKSASIFAGWFQVGGGEWDFDDPVTSSITLRADWMTHFTRSYQGDVVLITLEQPYVGNPTTVDWGDGMTSSGSVSFSHQYGSETSGIITVTTSYGLTGDTVSSSIRFQISGGGTDPNPVHPKDPDDSGIPMWAIVLALIAVAAIVLAVWRLS